MRHFLFSCSVLAGWVAYAYPGTPVIDNLAVRASGAASGGTFVAVGVNTTVEINGQNKTRTSPNDFPMFDLGPGTLDNVSVKIWRVDPALDSAPYLRGSCTLSGTPTGGAEFVTASDPCFIRSMTDGSLENYGMKLKCDPPPYGGTCQLKMLVSMPPTSTPTDSV